MRCSLQPLFVIVTGLLLCQPSFLLANEPPAAPPTKASKDKPAIYDESADAPTQIAAAVALAKAENRRVLIQWGGNWCSWCLRLHELYTKNADIAKELQYEYVVVFVDAGKDFKNVQFAGSYNADVAKQGFPYLTILDASGKPIANQESGSLEVKGADSKSAGVAAGHDPALVLKFLKDHQAPYRSATEILDQGLADAKATNRMVFLHFGAPWCGWCHRLEAWMHKPEIAALLAKDFVDVKIDVDRTIGGNDIFAKYNPKSKSSGIPWFVFLDSAGKPIADSFMPGGQNTGFPGDPKEVEYFASMLKKASTNLTPADIDTLVKSLQEPKPTSH